MITRGALVGSASTAAVLIFRGSANRYTAFVLLFFAGIDFVALMTNALKDNK